MRPLRLRLAGVRSYADETTVDFADRGLVAVVGDTGAGKSSLLEAIVYALYNRSTFEGRSRDLIAHGAEAMEVALDFAVEGRRFRVTRSRSDSGYPPARHELVCLDDPDGEAVDGEAAVTAEVERLVGLGPAAFLKTIVLPQGRFAELLRATPTDRSRVLRGIFRLEHLEATREEARAARDRAEDALRPLEDERARLPADPDAEIAARRGEHAAADGARRSLVAAAREHREASDRADEAARHAAGARAALRSLDLAAGAQALKDLEGAVRAAEALAAEGAAVARRAEELDRRRARLRAHLDGAGDGGLGRDELSAAASRLGDLADLHQRRIRLDPEIRRAEAAADDARRAAEAAARAVGDGRARLRSAEAGLAEAERSAMVAALVHGHEAGDDCPVCRAALPAEAIERAAGRADLARARRAVDEARAATEAEQRQAADAERRRTEAESAARTLAGARADAVRAVEEVRLGLPEAVRPPSDPSAADIADLEREVARRRREQAARRERLDRLDEERRATERAARAVDEQRRRRVDEPRLGALRALDRLHEALARAAEVAGRPVPAAVAGGTPGAEAASARALVDAAEAVAGRLDAVAAEADAAGRSAREAARAVLGTHSCDDADALIDARDAAAAAAAATAGALETALAQGPRARELDRATAPARELADDLRVLEGALAPSAFPREAAAARQHALLDVATEILGGMTGGRYALDAEFGVVDRVLGGRRGVRTLSGGETFLASLALSLALVEMTDRSGGRAEALFLDEGFGQLDADALDAALGELERRARDGRLVAVVSHVHAVAERVEDVLHVTADGTGRSSARWLDADARQALLDRDAAGLVAV